MQRSRKRKLQRLRTRALLVGMPLATGMLAVPPYALAQESSESGALEEIVVTAQKRAESLQDVPLSIQAFGTAQLERLRVGDFKDVAKFLPSVSYKTVGPGFARVFMRGVAAGDNGNHSGSQPSVGIYLDEQPITTIQGALDVHVYDIARVEALSGPQGTLYGASSQAGTIRIITNKPDPKGFSSAYDVQLNQVSAGGTGYSGEGYVNLPVSDNAAIRLVGWAEHQAGYIDNVRGTRTYPVSGITLDNRALVKNDYNDVDTVGARAALRVDLNDRWTLTPTVMGQEQKANGIFGFDPKVGELKVSHWYPENSRDRWMQAAMTVEGKISNLDLVYAGSYLKRDVDTNSDYTDYSFFYDAVYGAYFYDNAGTLINPSQYVVGKDGYTKMSHELRISSPAENRLRFVAGLFMQRQTHRILQRYKVDRLASLNSVTGWPDTIWLTQQLRTDRDYAAFGELTYDLTDQLSVTGGMRFFKAKNSLAGFFGFASNYGSSGERQCGPPSTWVKFEGAPCTNLDKTVTQNDSTHRLNVTYRFDPDRMVYATWSRGFRPGGVNRRGTFPPYRSDFLTNYEIGWKTTWADNRVRFNGAAYMLDWKDFQYSFLGQNGLTNVTNAGSARITGIEADLDWAVTPDLLLTGGIALLEPKLTSDFCKQLGTDGLPLSTAACIAADPTNFAPNGTQLPVTPRFKANLTARYSFALGSFEANVQGSVVHQGASRSSLLPADEPLLGRQDAFTLVDLSVGIEKDGMSASLFVNNASDDLAGISRYAECATQVCGTQSYLVPNTPRMVGLKFGQKF
jgi:outer membrane receptor protein involved in Fe transport